jgi:hypothetical protein
MQRRLARMTSSANSSGRIAPTPSPHSTDDLLPTLEEDKQVNGRGGSQTVPEICVKRRCSFAERVFLDRNCK